MSGDLLEEEVQKKLEPTALSCFLNTAACKLKMQLWQDALDSCSEVHLAVLSILNEVLVRVLTLLCDTELLRFTAHSSLHIYALL